MVNAPPPRRPAPIRPYGLWDENDEDANAPGDSYPDRRSIRVVQDKPTRRVDNLCYRLVFCEGTQPGWHALRRHKCAAGESQRKKPDETSGLRSLDAIHHQADCC